VTVQHDLVQGETEGSERVVRRVLLVDDNAGDRTMVRRLLRDQRQDANRSYELIEVITGAEGLARCRAKRFDCVLLDFHLSDMNGREFIDALRKNEREGAPVPILILTGHDDDDNAADVFRRGVEDYLVKDSLTSTSLVRAIENSIERFHVRRQLEEQRAAVELRNQRLVELRNELQSTVAELADATRAKDRFLAVMSHEMRTPLNAILGYAELLEMELDGTLTEGQRQQVERIRVGGRHLLDLTNDVLDLTRADALKLELDLRPVDVAAVVEDVAALLERQAEAKGIVLDISECESRLPHVQADLQRLRQVLTNIVGNAIKFTDEGSVRVRCLPPAEDGMVKIEVIDTGIGIEADVLPLVFEEFYQVRNDLTRRHGGSGLGLAISQRLARLMGGDITTSSTLGEGSTFTIWLRPASAGSELRPEDVAQHGARMARATACAQTPAPNRTPAKAAVTVVAYGQDVAALTELARRVSPGVRLVWTTTAEDVVRLVSLEHAALVVLDAGTADGAAWHAAQKLQDLPEDQMAAVLLLPSLSAAIPDETSQVLDLGWVSLVPKPFTAAQLTHAISTATGHLSSRSNGPGYDVLVVDDDDDSRRVAVRFLAEAGLTPRDVADGEAALTEMRRHPPDVVVLDLMMPVLDGFGVLAAMRADPTMCAIPVVVLTAKSLTEKERQFLSRTAARVLQKGAHRLGDVAALVMRAAARTSGAAAGG
jgi:signal transduction histidine kinase